MALPEGPCEPGPLDATAPRLARSIARSAGRRETVMRTLVCLEVFDERGLIRMERTTDHLHIALRPVEGKVDLDDSSILRALRASSIPTSRPCRPARWHACKREVSGMDPILER